MNAKYALLAFAGPLLFAGIALGLWTIGEYRKARRAELRRRECVRMVRHLRENYPQDRPPAGRSPAPCRRTPPAPTVFERHGRGIAR